MIITGAALVASTLRRWLAGLGVLVAVMGVGPGSAHALTVDEVFLSPEDWHVWELWGVSATPAPAYNGFETRCGPLRFRHRGKGLYARDYCEQRAAFLTDRCRNNMDAQVERGPDGEERIVWTLSEVVARHWNDCQIINAHACRCREQK